MRKRLLLGLCGAFVLGLAACGGAAGRGHGLLFVRQTRDVSRIYLWRPGAPAPAAIGPKGNWIGSVAWSPDGKEIAFDAQRGAWDQANDSYVYEMRADGSGVRQVSPGAAVGPIWSPNGDELLYYRGTADGRDPLVFSIRTGSERTLPIGSGPASWGKAGVAYVVRGSRTVKLLDPTAGLSTVFARATAQIDGLTWVGHGRLAVLEGAGRWIGVYTQYGRLLARFPVARHGTACGIASSAGGAELLVAVKDRATAWTTTLDGERWRRLPRIEPRGGWCRSSWSWR